MLGFVRSIEAAIAMQGTLVCPQVQGREANHQVQDDHHYGDGRRTSRRISLCGSGFERLRVTAAVPLILPSPSLAHAQS